MNTQMTEHPRDWDAQRERLSASLDGRLSDAERAELERHVSGCARCTAELAALRRTVALLRTLPPPALPRSFALPVAEDASGGGEEGGRPERPPAGARAGDARARAGRRGAAAVQWAGSVAAGIGLVLLLGSALSGVGSHPFGAATTAAGSYSAAAPARSVPPEDQTTATSTAHQPASAPSPTAAPTATATPGGANGADGAVTPTAVGSGSALGPQQPTATSGPSHKAHPAATRPPLPPAPLAGAGLLLGGLAAFALGRRMRRRSTG